LKSQTIGQLYFICDAHWFSYLVFC